MSVLGLAAVHVEDLSADEVCIRRSKKEDGAGKVLGLLIPLHSTLLGLLCYEFLRHVSLYGRS